MHSHSPRAVVHELSIANNILDIIRQHVPVDQFSLVKSIRLKIGDQAGVVVDSLEFSFSALTAESPLRGARLEVERIPFVVSCRQCGESAPSESGIVACPRCGSVETTIVSGTELRVTEIELLEPEPEGA